MRNLWVVALGFSAIAPCTLALAENTAAPSAAALMVMCTPLIQKGNVNPPEPVDNLQTVQLCQSHCDTLFPADADRGEAMLKSAGNCKKSLNNLYFSSVAKINIDQLNQQLPQHSTDLSVFEKLNSIIHQQPRVNAADFNRQENPPAPENSAAVTTPAPAPNNNQTPSYDNINW